MSKKSRSRGRRYAPTGEAPAVAGGAGHWGAGHYKDAQLSTQAEEALVVALGASYDRVLRELTVAGVVPLRGGAALEVIVHAGGGEDLERVREKLERARGYLRSEVAAAIYRKRTPELSFVVLPGGEGLGHGLGDVDGDDDPGEDEAEG